LFEGVISTVSLTRIAFRSPENSPNHQNSLGPKQTLFLRNSFIEQFIANFPDTISRLIEAFTTVSLELLRAVLPSIPPSASSLFAVRNLTGEGGSYPKSPT
jgi:hypothetical protein